jgi:ABC-type multidrug transport system fused ATPase/permease subunit
VKYYLGWYVAIMAAIIATCSWKVIMATLASIRVGRVVHDELTASLLASTFRWLDVTPVSRIVARCTQDIQALDGALMHSTTEFVALVVMCASRLVAIALYAPVYILPALVIGLVGLVLGQMYIRAQLSVKRERSIAKACVIDDLFIVCAYHAFRRPFSLPSMKLFQASRPSALSTHRPPLSPQA